MTGTEEEETFRARRRSPTMPSRLVTRWIITQSDDQRPRSGGIIRDASVGCCCCELYNTPLPSSSRVDVIRSAMGSTCSIRCLGREGLLHLMRALPNRECQFLAPETRAGVLTASFALCTFHKHSNQCTHRKKKTRARAVSSYVTVADIVTAWF